MQKENSGTRTELWGSPTVKKEGNGLAKGTQQEEIQEQRELRKLKEE